jgi:hypothetical protein
MIRYKHIDYKDYRKENYKGNPKDKIYIHIFILISSTRKIIDKINTERDKGKFRKKEEKNISE